MIDFWIFPLSTIWGAYQNQVFPEDFFQRIVWEINGFGMMSSGIFVSMVRKTSSKIVLLEFVKKMVLSMVKVWFSFVG